MKKIILVFIFSFLIQQAFGCCAGSFVHIYPSENKFSKNPVFLLEFSDQDFSILRDIDSVVLYIEYKNGKTIKLNFTTTSP